MFREKFIIEKVRSSTDVVEFMPTFKRIIWGDMSGCQSPYQSLQVVSWYHLQILRRGSRTTDQCYMRYQDGTSQVQGTSETVCKRWESDMRPFNKWCITSTRSRTQRRAERNKETDDNHI